MALSSKEEKIGQPVRQKEGQIGILRFRYEGEARKQDQEAPRLEERQEAKQAKEVKEMKARPRVSPQMSKTAPSGIESPSPRAASMVPDFPWRRKLLQG